VLVHTEGVGRAFFFVVSVVGVVAIACSSGNEKTPDGGTLYTSPPSGDVSCNSDSDCCVAVDTCHSIAYVVHAGDALDLPQTGCNFCVAPAVEVWCSGGKCQSAVLPVSAQITPYNNDHCGPFALDGGTPSDSGVHGCQ